MPFEQKPNSGALFKNDRKQQDNHPDYTGSAEINGTSYWISAWLKESKKGKFMSLSFKPKEDRQAQFSGAHSNSRPQHVEDSSVPF